jgi:metallo-beta-lactamase family protein
MDVSLTFCGAARTVTGLCLLFEAPGARFLVDCGMFQGPKTLKALNHEPFPFDPRDLDFVLLTHAHIDHSGLIPRLAREGFRGPVHATEPTRDLCACLLPDSGHIQESEVEQLNRRNRRRGFAPVRPIYTAEDAERSLALFRPVAIGAWQEPAPGVGARWWNAGHMLGSASIELRFGAGPGALRVLVSGDLGPEAGSLQPPAEGPEGGLDHLIVESTYGDEDRPEVTPEARRRALAQLLRDAARQDGALLIPVFAVERAQEVVLDLVRLMDEGAAPAAPIHLDSPLANRASQVFLRHVAETAEAEALAAALRSQRLRPVPDAEESRRLARSDGFRVVLAGSGMCEAGRIREHLRSGLWNPRTIVALVGFQAQGTLGRLLEEGADRVRIQGETVRVGARIARIEGYSGHADGPELLSWISARAPIRGGAFLVHGEPEAIEGLAARVTEAGLLPSDAVVRPLLDERFRLLPGVAPRRDPRPGAGRRLHPETVGAPDWHNRRAALLLAIEAALDEAPDEAARSVLMRRLRGAMGQAAQ